MNGKGNGSSSADDCQRLRMMCCRPCIETTIKKIRTYKQIKVLLF